MAHANSKEAEQEEDKFHAAFTKEEQVKDYLQAKHNALINLRDLHSVHHGRVDALQNIEAALGKINVGAKAAPPVLFLNVLSHHPRGATLETLFEGLTGKHISELGGNFKHLEGFRRIVYSDGTVQTQVLRQETKHNRLLTPPRGKPT